MSRGWQTYHCTTPGPLSRNADQFQVPTLSWSYHRLLPHLTDSKLQGHEKLSCPSDKDHSETVVSREIERLAHENAVSGNFHRESCTRVSADALAWDPRKRTYSWTVTAAVV